MGCTSSKSDVQLSDCRNGFVEAARLLLEKGADRTLADEEGETAMDYVDADEDEDEEGEDGPAVTEETKEQLRALLA